MYVGFNRNESRRAARKTKEGIKRTAPKHMVINMCVCVCARAPSNTHMHDMTRDKLTI